MAYGEFKSSRHNEPAVFEAFFRKHPFKGRYTVSAGIDEVMLYLKNYKFDHDTHIAYLKQTMPNIKETDPFWQWLESLNISMLTEVHGISDG